MYQFKICVLTLSKIRLKLNRGTLQVTPNADRVSQMLMGNHKLGRSSADGVSPEEALLLGVMGGTFWACADAGLSDG